MTLSLKNKNIILTGASQGFGLLLSEYLVHNGANLAICSRSCDEIDATRNYLASFLQPEQFVIAQKVDVSCVTEVSSFIEFVIASFGSVDCLINNAGVYGPIESLLNTNYSEWEEAVKINLFGSVLMTKSVIPHMISRRRGKIIQMSGGGATSPMPMFSSYATSKAAIVRFQESLALELEDFNIDINCVAPGALNTRLLDQVLRAGPSKAGPVAYQKSLTQKDNGGADHTHACELISFLCSDTSNGITGKLISALWDDWREWPSKINALRDSDIYTIRRLTDKERSI